jgi:secondary thiamine-phosphate synthase enzyme
LLAHFLFRRRTENAKEKSPHDNDEESFLNIVRLSSPTVFVGIATTGEVQAAVHASGVVAGTVTVFVKHTSCSLIIMENADPTARRDLEEFFEHLVPENTPYFEHTAEGPDDSTSHIRSVLTRSTEAIPIADGRIQLGTWQGIFLFEHRRAPHRREVALSIIGDTIDTSSDNR